MYISYVCIFTLAVYVMYISHTLCKWSAVCDFQKFQVGCQEMKVRMSCAGLRNLLQGLSFSAKYYSNHNPPQTMCPYSKIGPKKCHTLDCSKLTCTHRTAPPGSIQPCRFFSCKVCCLNINLIPTTTLAHLLRDTVILFTCWRSTFSQRIWSTGIKSRISVMFKDRYHCSAFLCCFDIKLHFGWFSH